MIEEFARLPLSVHLIVLAGALMHVRAISWIVRRTAVPAGATVRVQLAGTLRALGLLVACTAVIQLLVALALAVALKVWL